jgi:hypothetical protein
VVLALEPVVEDAAAEPLLEAAAAASDEKACEKLADP